MKSKRSFSCTVCLILILILILLLLATTLFSCSSGNKMVEHDYGVPSSAPNETDGSSLISELADGVTATDQKLIKSSYINAETKNFDEAFKAIEKAISENNGYIESMKNEGNSYGSRRSSRALSATIRIPAENYSAFVNGMGNIVNVVSSSSDVVNVTEKYYDAEARLDTLKAERESLQKMMASLDNANQYEFWITLQRRLSEVEQNISSLEVQLKSYDNKVSYSTVSFYMREVIELTDTDEITFGKRIADEFAESWQSFGEFWQDVAIFAVSALPVMLTLGAIAAVIIIIVNSANKKKKKQ